MMVRRLVTNRAEKSIEDLFKEMTELFALDSGDVSPMLNRKIEEITVDLATVLELFINDNKPNDEED